jgi:ABC-type branched-subunit amino acid transport system ATPase component
VTIVALDAVTVRFGGVHALDGVTAGIEAGRVTALIGPNGAGKTTLMNVVCGLTRAAAGSIRFLGTDVTRLRPHRIARLGMARTFQTAELFGGLTVLDNVLVGRHARMRAGAPAAALRLPRHRRDEREARRAAERLLERLGLGDVAREPATALPHDLQRRTELARALASEPRLLLLDEPLAGLSATEAAELGRTLRELVADGLTVLLVDHAMEAVMALADHVVVLDRGALLAEGPPDAIQADERVIAAYLGDEAA